MTGGIGASVRRDEDSRFRNGAGNDTGDTNRRGQHTEGSAYPSEMVDVVHGVTGKMPFGIGAYISRSLAVGT